MPRPDAGRQGDADRLVDPAELLDRDAEAGEVAALAGAAVLLRHDEAEQPEVAHLGHEVGREVAAASHLAMWGATSFSAKSRTTLRKSSWSWLSSNIAVLLKAGGRRHALVTRA